MSKLWATLDEIGTGEWDEYFHPSICLHVMENGVGFLMMLNKFACI